VFLDSIIITCNINKLINYLNFQWESKIYETTRSSKTFNSTANICFMFRFMVKRKQEEVLDKTRRVKNPNSGALITVGGTIFLALIRNSVHFYDAEKNVLVKNQHSNPEKETKIEIPIIFPDLKLIQLDPGYQGKFEKIIHFSDVHIPTNLHISGREEYESVFAALYTKIQELAENHKIGIVITGDLIHTKLDVQNETNILARNFLARLGQIAPIIVIIGNHDFLESNHDRADSLTVVSDRLKNVYPLKSSGLYELGGILFSFSSLFDNRFITAKEAETFNPRNLPMYKLFHGTVQGSINCNGKMNRKTHGSTEYLKPMDFDGYSAVLLGHIHFHQSLSIPYCEIVYAGSLMQQNFGEKVEGHGFVLWDIATHKWQFHPVQNEFVKINIHVTDGKILPYDMKVLEDHKTKHLSLKFSCTNTSIEQYDALRQYAKITWDIRSMRLAAPLKSTRSTRKPVMEADGVEIIDNVQMELNLMKEHTIRPDLYDDLAELHTIIRTETFALGKIDNDDSTVSHWEFVSMRFQNALKYGNDIINTIEFKNGIYSISAPNTAGKTSLLCIALFGFFGRISQTASLEKNEMLHTGKQKGFIEVRFAYNGQVYSIIRKLMKNTDGRPRTETLFYRELNQLTGEKEVALHQNTPANTQKEINARIGDFEIFKMLHIISTRFSPALLLMTPGDKFKYILKLCAIEKYDEYRNKCKDEYLKPREIEFREINSQIKVYENLMQQQKEKIDGFEMTQEDDEKNNQLLDELKVQEKITLKENLDLQCDINCILIKLQQLGPSWLPDHDIDKLFEKFKFDNSDWNIEPSPIPEPPRNYTKLNETYSEDGIDSGIINLVSILAGLKKPDNTLSELVHEKLQIEMRLQENNSFNNELNQPDRDACKRILDLQKDMLLIPKLSIMTRLAVIENQKVTIENIQKEETKMKSTPQWITRNIELINIRKTVQGLKESDDLARKEFFAHELFQFIDRVENGSLDSGKTSSGSIQHLENKNYEKLCVEQASLQEALRVHIVQDYFNLYQINDGIKWWTIHNQHENLIEKKTFLQYAKLQKTAESALQIQKRRHWFEKSVELKRVKLLLEEKSTLLDEISEKKYKMQQRATEFANQLSLMQKLQKDISKDIENRDILAYNIIIYEEYIRLFDKPQIPGLILTSKMEQFKDRVNQIFNKYTNYNFNVIVDSHRHGSLSFAITQKKTNIPMEPERLSGFESVVLLLAINYAALSLSSRIQCSF
jgi:DNA repair exonuclease SbcCD ATPase subunit